MKKTAKPKKAAKPKIIKETLFLFRGLIRVRRLWSDYRISTLPLGFYKPRKADYAPETWKWMQKRRRRRLP